MPDAARRSSRERMFPLMSVPCSGRRDLRTARAASWCMRWGGTRTCGRRSSSRKAVSPSQKRRRFPQRGQGQPDPSPSRRRAPGGRRRPALPGKGRRRPGRRLRLLLSTTAGPSGRLRTPKPVTQASLPGVAEVEEIDSHAVFRPGGRSISSSRMNRIAASRSRLARDDAQDAVSPSHCRRALTSSVCSACGRAVGHCSNWSRTMRTFAPPRRLAAAAVVPPAPVRRQGPASNCTIPRRAALPFPRPSLRHVDGRGRCPANQGSRPLPGRQACRSRKGRRSGRPGTSGRGRSPRCDLPGNWMLSGPEPSRSRRAGQQLGEEIGVTLVVDDHRRGDEWAEATAVGREGRSRRVAGPRGPGVGLKDEDRRWPPGEAMGGVAPARTENAADVGAMSRAVV